METVHVALEMIRLFSTLQVLHVVDVNFILTHCVATEDNTSFGIFEFPARTTNTACVKL